MELIEQPVIARGREEHLKSGMVFALEPKMVFLNEFSAGIESGRYMTPMILCVSTLFRVKP